MGNARDPADVQPSTYLSTSYDLDACTCTNSTLRVGGYIPHRAALFHELSGEMGRPDPSSTASLSRPAA